MAKGGKSGQPRAKKAPGMLRHVLAENLKTKLGERYPGFAKTEAEKKLALATGLSPSTIQRLCGGATGASLDNIERIAAKLRTSVITLLTPSTESKIALGLEGGVPPPAEEFRGRSKPD